MARRRTREEIYNSLRYEKENWWIHFGMLIQRFLDLKKLQVGYEWEPEEIKVFADMDREYLKAYNFKEMDVNDIHEQMMELREIGIDLISNVQEEGEVKWKEGWK